MFRHRRTALAVSLAGTLAALTGVAHAAERNFTLTGDALKITTPCAKSVHITTAAGGHTIRIQAMAEDQGEVDQLTSTTSGATAQLGATSQRCYRRGNRDWNDWQPTLEIEIAVPAGIPLEIKESGSTDYVADGDYGATVLTLDGSGDVKGGSIKGGIQVQSRGSGDVALDRLDGALTLRSLGSGTLAIDQMTGPALDLEISGSGNVTLHGGSVGPATVKLSGSGDVQLPAVASLRLVAHGSGDTEVERVQGALSADLAGSGSLAIRSVTAPTAVLNQSGNGDVTIDGGTIGTLTAAITGSGEATIMGTVTDAAVSLSGSGDMHIAAVTGHMNKTGGGSGTLHVDGH
ncbi:MAG: DUF2807 domain-containing protein [Azospirillaceae bacterium]|nr:DUF2807 domain-containing protein [Azospirillaceae bacterium]